MEQKEYKFEFSVVMAVYNVEPWLREAVDSLIAQDFGFENIQLIMVDDGSTDGSGAICDEYAARYPENVTVVHKANGGVSSARNAGMGLIQGRYVNFLDADDKLSENAMTEVHRFYGEYAAETDIAALPIIFFDGAKGGHPLNRKFEKGNRVIDLSKEYTNVQLSLSSTFVKSEKLVDRSFDERLAFAEDAKLVVQVLLEKGTLGAIQTAKYLYRKRTAGESSAIQRSQTNAKWYLPCILHFQKSTMEYCQECYGYVPKFVQFTLMYDLQWRIKQKSIPQGVLTAAEENEYKQLLLSLLVCIDDEIIMGQRHISPELKAWAIEKKYGRGLRLVRWQNEGLLAVEDTALFSLAKSKTTLEFFTIKDGICSIEGYATIYPAHIQDVQIHVKVNGELMPCERVERGTDAYALDEPISCRYGFKCAFPLSREREHYDIRVITVIQGIEIGSKNLAAGKFFPVSRTYRTSYYVQDGWSLSVSGDKLTITSCGRRGHVKKELAFLKELWRKNAVGGRKAVLGRIAYHALKAIKRKQIWLISDRINKADDNGEAFFRYMQENHKDKIKSYFVLSKSSSDYGRMKKIGSVVDNLSWRHKLLFLLCDYNISAQADEITFNPFSGYQDGVRDILSQERFIFLQHGVINQDLSNWLNRYNKNIYGLVVSAEPEYISIIGGDYSYSEKEIWKTGLPRFDRRYHDEKKKITIMPTWRMYLMEAADSSTSLRKLKPNFTESAYFKFYHALLNSEKLFRNAKARGYQICFFPHPNVQKHLDKFEISSEVEVLNIDTKYNDVYAQSDLVITDYSSAVFDFAYLRKPIVYCHFDAEEFFAGEHTYTRGYFDYERDGFGEVEYDLESTVDRIIEYMENGCQLKEKYRRRIDGFFAFNDKNNCQRVYEKIMELDGRK